MGVIDNVKGIMRSLSIRQKEKSIGRDAVIQGNIESKFLANYETFKVGLKVWLENIILTKGNYMMVISPKEGTDASKYLRYTLEDPEISNFYDIRKRPGGEYEFREKDTLDDIVERPEDYLGGEEVVDDNIIYVDMNR